MGADEMLQIFQAGVVRRVKEEHAKKLAAALLPTVVLMNPDNLTPMRLFGMRVRLDSTLQPGEIRCVQEEPWPKPMSGGMRDADSA